MNDHGTYTRKLMRWGIELDLIGSIHYRLSSYSKNKAWCRAEDAYLLLGGSEADVGELVTRIRTQKMTRHDTHERKSQILWGWQQQSQQLGDLVVGEECSKPGGCGFSLAEYTNSEELKRQWDVAVGLTGVSFGFRELVGLGPEKQKQKQKALQM
jgi:hypothetical protein